MLNYLIVNFHLRTKTHRLYVLCDVHAYRQNTHKFELLKLQTLVRDNVPTEMVAYVLLREKCDGIHYVEMKSEKILT